MFAPDHERAAAGGPGLPVELVQVSGTAPIANAPCLPELVRTTLVLEQLDAPSGDVDD
jgi:hypothetical protein